MLKSCQNCIFFSPYATFRQKQNNCVHIDHKKVIKDVSQICSSFIISQKKMKEYLEEQKEKEILYKQKLIALEIKKQEEFQLWSKKRNKRISAFLSLQQLCKQHKLAFEMLSTGLVVTSYQDKWYIEVHDETFSLFHKNKKKDTTHYHHQKDFSIYEPTSIIRYLLKHDDYVAFHRNTYWKSQNVLNPKNEII